MSTQAEQAGAEQTADVAELTYRDAVNAALLDEMTSDATVYFMGEDVGTAGGVFKTNEGLAEAFPGRVINTPICENGFVGVALGMAVTGLRPVVEIHVQRLPADGGGRDRQRGPEVPLHVRRPVRGSVDDPLDRRRDRAVRDAALGDR